MREGTGRDDLAEQFRRFAVGVRLDGALRYSRLCEGIACDERLLGLVAEAPPDQRRPNILLAAVHFLLLSGVDDPLASFYPTVLAWRGADPASALGADDTGLFPAFAALCDAHRDAVSALIATRATQTNEVGRCAAIFPALSVVGSRAGAPLALVDLGAAAGLNLLFDRYAYDYGGPVAGERGSPVVLHCDARGGHVPTASPAVAARVGLDRRPVDIFDDDETRWLLACQWPDHLERFDTTRRALDLARSVPDPPVVRRGDAVEDLAALTASLPADARLCVLHSWVAAYFTPAQQRALADAIAAIARTRPVSWIFAEAPYEVPGLPVPPPPGEKVRGASALVLVEQGPRTARAATRLADMHAHGRWLHWYGAPAPSATR